MSNKMSPTEVSKELREDTTKTQATVLSRPADTQQAKAAQAERDSKVSADQEQSLQQAAATAETQRQVIRNRIPRGSGERAIDTIHRYLLVFKNSPVGSPEKVDALQKIIATVSRFPRKAILDEILQFFRDNRDEDWLGPMQALQGTLTVDRSTNIKIRTFYGFMSELASGTATRKTISLDVIRNIFGSDELVNWVALKLAHTR